MALERNGRRVERNLTSTKTRLQALVLELLINRRLEHNASVTKPLQYLSVRCKAKLIIIFR